MTTKPFKLGLVIAGTTKPEELLPAFTHELAMRDPGHLLVYDTMSLEKTLGLLTTDLNKLCPPGVYFGKHPTLLCVECDGIRGDNPSPCRLCGGAGTNADYGFWPDWDDNN